MSVNTSEDYLDELLQAIEPILQLNKREPDPEPEPETEPTVIDEIIDEELSVEELMATADSTEAEVVEEEAIEEIEAGMDLSEFFTVDEEPVDTQFVDAQSEVSQQMSDEDEHSAAIGDLLASLTAEMDDITFEEDEVTEADIESMLDAASSQPQEMEEPADYNEDVKDLLKQFKEDADLSDIQDMLDKNDNGEALDESLLDLPDVEVFQLEETPDEDEEEEPEVKKGLLSKLKGGLAGIFKRKKEKQEVEEVAEDEEQTEVIMEDASGEFEELDEMSLLDALTGGSNDVQELELDEDMSDIEMLLNGGALQGSDFVQDSGNQVEYLDEPEAVSGSKKKSGKEKKKVKEKKESIFTKILNLLTEEYEESPKKGVPEANATGITDENLDILESLSKEDKKKATKQDKKKAKKNGKNASKKGGDDEVDEKGAKSKKNKKDKKPKKKREKKEKPDKLVVVTKPEKKLPKRRVLSTFALCFSILAGVLILQNVVMKTDNIKEAKYAFDTSDYATCFANVSSMEKRNEEEEALYQKSLIILSVQRKLDSYENFILMNRNVEALNSLLEGVIAYREQEALAMEWGVQPQLAVIYQSIMDKLQGFGLSAADVEEILAYESKVTYTKRLDSIVNGTPFHPEEMMENFEVAQPQPFEDVLPGEEDFLPDNTMDVTSNAGTTEYDVETGEEDMYVEQHGQTVVVGSNPVNIEGGSQDDFGGQNVGNGGTNVSIEVDGGNVVIGDM